MPDSTAQETFRSLHAGSAPLLLPNAWDAGSAALIESLGAKAIATTSAGLSWARGYADGDALPPDELVAAARAITRAVRLPLSVDMEAGYSNEPPAVAELALRLADVGAVGINIEDGSHAPDLLCRKIEAIRRAVGAGMFINARIDVLLRALATGDAAVEAICRRAESYRAAGCDGIFVPGLAELQGMATIARAIAPLPLNVMLLRGLPGLEVLQQHGVRRLSAGSALAQAALAHTAGLVAKFLAGDAQAVFGAPGADYSRTNALFAKR